ncbi:hypothetical protein DQ354_09740 [Arthrobacter sp. AQ5-06]|nr:hypothetical protein DQ354_09740 [Arthrobacter sp. AQ5-06]
MVPLFTFWLAGLVVLDHDMDAAVSSFLFYVHVAIDDNTRYGYAELLPDGNGATDAGFRIRAASYSPDTASNGSSASSPTTRRPTATPPRSARPLQTKEPCSVSLIDPRLNRNLILSNRVMVL